MTSSRKSSRDLSTSQLYDDVTGWAMNNLRSFPWRETKDPYKIFLAECLLRRTTSKAAVRVYESLISKYPDVFHLANADSIEEYLKPVGLYRQRGKQILRGARYVAGELKGVFPEEQEGLSRIPGIGEYGASIIASLAFGQSTPAVDSNVTRILTRLRGVNWISRKEAEILLAGVIRGRDTRQFNLGMIDIGGTVCMPIRPKCYLCPLKQFCRYFRHNAISLRRK
ncbi:MAG: hypothetical protein QXU18_12315 [Thermoplasmatales archaeon]